MRPIEPPAGQQPDLAAVESGVNAIAIELDFVQPVRPPPPASFTSLFNRGCPLWTDRIGASRPATDLAISGTWVYSGGAPARCSPRIFGKLRKREGPSVRGSGVTHRTPADR